MANKKPLEVLGSKMYPSKAQLTKIMFRDLIRKTELVFYVRENTKAGVQILELLCEDPDPAKWEQARQIVALEDSMKREVVSSPEFTVEWAEAELTRKDEA